MGRSSAYYSAAIPIDDVNLEIADVCDYTKSALREFVQSGEEISVEVLPVLGHVGREVERRSLRGRLCAGGAGVGEEGDGYEGRQGD